MKDKIMSEKPIKAATPRTIIIAGGGLNGLTLALALKQALGDAIHLILADPALNRDPALDRRSFAVAPASRRMFEALGVWDDDAIEAQPVLDMVITDSRLADPVRPTLMTFAEGRIKGEPLAYLVENARLTATVMAAARALDIDFVAGSIDSFSPASDGVDVTIAGRSPIRAALLVAADGKRSRLRDVAGIGWVSWSYKQVGIVGTIAHERDHEGKAYEHFLPAGPFASLPLVPGGSLGHRSSIVWTEEEETAAYLMEFGDNRHLAEVERRFGPILGKLSLETKLQSFPLSFGIARSFTADRMVLLGDAAHAIHPIAGQGLNLGLEDVAVLAEIIVDSFRLGLDPGAADRLALYENARRFDVTVKGLAMDGINRLFSNDVTPLRLMRDFGLGVVNRLPELKRFFADRAAGDSGQDAPRLMQGEML